MRYLLLLAVVSVASATSSRLSSLGGFAQYYDDEALVALFPTTARAFPWVSTLELGVVGADETRLLRTIVPVGDDGRFGSLSAQLNTQQLVPPAWFMGYYEPDAGFYADYVLPLGVLTTSLGGGSFVRAANDPIDSVSTSVYAGRAGARWEGGRYAVEAALDYSVVSGFERQDTVVTLPRRDGSGFYARSRGRVDLSAQSALVPFIGYVSFGTTGPADVDYGELTAGTGYSVTPVTGISVTAGAQGQLWRETTNDTTTAFRGLALFASAEYAPFSFFVVRFGGVKYVHGRLSDPTFSSSVSNFYPTVGFGFNLKDFALDAYTNPNALLAGPYFFGGTVRDVLYTASLRYRLRAF